jgi:hypothetical protein
MIYRGTCFFWGGVGGDPTRNDSGPWLADVCRNSGDVEPNDCELSKGAAQPRGRSAGTRADHEGVRSDDARCKVFMPSFIVFRLSLFVVIFHVVFEVSLLVEVRLRGSFSALG